MRRYMAASGSEPAQASPQRTADAQDRPEPCDDAQADDGRGLAGGEAKARAHGALAAVVEPYGGRAREITPWLTVLSTI